MKPLLVLAGALALACAPARADDTQSPWADARASAAPAAESKFFTLRRVRGRQEFVRVYPRARRAEIGAPLDIRTPAQLADVALRYVGSAKFTRLPGAWCRDGLNVWLRVAGFHTDGDRRAATLGRIVRPLARPVPGAIAWQRHHAAVVLRVDGARVTLISANYSHRVKIHTAAVRSYRYGAPQRG